MSEIKRFHAVETVNTGYMASPSSCGLGQAVYHRYTKSQPIARRLPAWALGTFTVIDKMVIKVYRAEGDNLPVIYSNDYSESGSEVLEACGKLGCRPFHLVTVSGACWDQSMSPWPSEPVVTKNDHFTGKGPEYLSWFLETVVPYAQEQLGADHPVSYISGYSMAGLFALWSMYETDVFSGCVCVSGSLWFPGFEEFALRSDMKRMPESMYLSLGDRESKVKNPALQKTEGVFRTLNEHYKESGIHSIFELNPGNHFKDMPLRVAKGYQWILQRTEDEDD